MNPKIKRIAQHDGFTLTEILIALVLAGILIVAISNLEIARGRMSQTTESLITIQREAIETVQHVHKRVFNAYYLWWPQNAADRDKAVWVQTIDPAKVADANGVPDPARITSSNPANWPNFLYYGYQLESAGQEQDVVYYENVKPRTTDPVPGLTVRRTVLCHNVSGWTIKPITPGGVDANGLRHDNKNGLQVQLTVTGPRTGKSFTIGPTNFISRSMAANPPDNWQPAAP